MGWAHYGFWRLMGGRSAVVLRELRSHCRQASCTPHANPLAFSLTTACIATFHSLRNLCRWTRLPGMPTARWVCAAVDVPGVGVLVVGGAGRPGEYLKTAELLEAHEAGVGRWRTIEPMIEKRWMPSAVYFDGAVFVGSAESRTVELLSLPSSHPGQWTLVSTHPSPGRFVISMCVLNGQIILAGEIAVLN